MKVQDEPCPVPRPGLAAARRWACLRSRSLTCWAIAELGLRGDERVLDLACGTGRSTRELLLALPAGFVDAMEGSGDLLRRSGRRNREDLDRGRLVLHRAALPQRVTGPGVFDVLFGLYAVELLPDPDVGVAAALDLLKPGGRLALASTYRHNLPDTWRSFADRAALRTYRPREIDALLRRAGFVEVRERGQPSGRGILVTGRRPPHPAA